MARLETQIEGGIIPARAGFTTAAGCRRSPTGDHPRSRGVYDCCGLPTVTHRGSSPLARGLLAALPQQVLTAGIIPARAGFTLLLSLKPWRCRDHPRSRGVYRFDVAARPISMGSSPLARGLHKNGIKKTADSRIIPARAGFTSAAVIPMRLA